MTVEVPKMRTGTDILWRTCQLSEPAYKRSDVEQPRQKVFNKKKNAEEETGNMFYFLKEKQGQCEKNQQ